MLRFLNLLPSLILLGILAAIVFSAPASANTTRGSGDHISLIDGAVLDDANLLPERLERSIITSFEQVGDVHKLDLYLVTVRDTGVLDPQTFLAGLVRNWRLHHRTSARDFLVMMIVPGEERWFMQAKGTKAEELASGAADQIWTEIVAPLVTQGRASEGIRLGLNALLRDLNSLSWQANKPVVMPSLVNVPELLASPVKVFFKLLVLILPALVVWWWYCFVGLDNLIGPRRIAGYDRPEIRGLYLPIKRDGPTVLETKDFADRTQSLRLQIHPIPAGTCTQPFADLLSLVLISAGLTQVYVSAGDFLSWNAPLGMPVVQGAALGLAAYAIIQVMRLLSPLVLWVSPQSVRDMAVKMQFQSVHDRLGRRHSVHRHAWFQLILCEELGRASLAYYPDYRRPLASNVVQNLAETLTEDLQRKPFGAAVRALIYGMSKHANWGELQEGSKSIDQKAKDEQPEVEAREDLAPEWRLVLTPKPKG